MHVCFKFTFGTTVFQRYTKIGLIYDKAIDIADDVIQPF